MEIIHWVSCCYLCTGRDRRRDVIDSRCTGFGLRGVVSLVAVYNPDSPLGDAMGGIVQIYPGIL